ncbi:S8 family peptidase [Streptomyces poriferorum]|uniref:S8 family peptidase n=1 Tax=Streptomyces poriferorum TaxID=2798799 RepID=UPI001F2796A7|nr:S8 family serine peptidase [Streptomyces poriferorum]
MAGGLLIPLQAAAQPAASGEADLANDTRGYDVTLITGDVVHYVDGPGARDTVTVDRVDGTAGGVEVRQLGDDYYVIPDEAAPLIAAGTLDRRLFDVTGLIDMGYDDARIDGLPVIATYGAAARSVPAVPAGSSLTHRLDSIHGAALTVKPTGQRAFWNELVAAPGKSRTLSAGVKKLWLDARVKGALKDSVPQIGAPAAWAEGYDGKGVKVAVLDTGIDPEHPDLKDRIVGSKSFVPGQAVLDGNGHGTHVASTVAGSGAASGGDYRGVAPAADLLVGKVLGNDGYGANSGIIEAMEWAKDQGAAVVSMSLGDTAPDDGTDPMAQAVNALSADDGPLFVIAAGNAYDPGAISTPGSADKALTVAAVDKNDERASFSSQGPLIGTSGLKPDISAPGVDITAAASQAMPGVTGMYRTLSGTSMATPHVAGAAAILKQRHPDWSGQQLKDALMSTSKELPDYTPYEMGTGRVDVAAAVDARITATGSLATASYDWPHSADDPVTERTLIYRNQGDTPVTLDLSTGTPDEAYTLSTGQVTVPAGGSTDAVLSLDPSKVDPGTTFSGQVTAEDHATGTVMAHTGFALAKERELYDFTINVLGQDGKPATGTVNVARLGSDTADSYEVSGSRTLRMAPGNYVVWTLLDVPGDGEDTKASAFLVDPETELAGDTSVTLDASKSRLISARTPKPTEARETRYEMVRTATDGTVIRSVVTLPIALDELWVSPTDKVTEGIFEFLTRWNLQEARYTYRAGKESLPALAQSAGAPVTGRLQMHTAYVHTGATADYADLDVKGKAVIVDRSDAVPPLTRVANATAAGAKALVVLSDRPGRLNESYARGGSAAIPVLSVRQSQAAGLLAQDERGKELTIDAQAAPSYLYDLVSRHPDRIPNRSLTYTPDPDRDLARLTNSFHSDRATTGYGYRYDVPTYGAAVGLNLEERYPMVRTDWVDHLEGGATWLEDHTMSDARGVQQVTGGLVTYAAGKRYTTNWFSPVQNPRVGTAYAGPYRDTNNNLSLSATPYSDGGAVDRSGVLDTGTSKMALYQGDTLLAQSSSRSVRALRRPAEVLPYRLVMDNARDADDWHTSVSSHSEWGFTSGAIPGGAGREPVRLLQPHFGVDTDMAGDVRSGHRVDLTLSASTQQWLNSTTYADSATLSVSYNDGATWQPVSLDRTGRGNWVAQFKLPKKPGGFVSLKATAEAANGLTVEQEVIRAFGLK